MDTAAQALHITRHETARIGGTYPEARGLELVLQDVHEQRERESQHQTTSWGLHSNSRINYDTNVFQYICIQKKKKKKRDDKSRAGF